MSQFPSLLSGISLLQTAATYKLGKTNFGKTPGVVDAIDTTSTGRNMASLGTSESTLDTAMSSASLTGNAVSFAKIIKPASAVARVGSKFVPGLNIITTGYDAFTLASTIRQKALTNPTYAQFEKDAIAIGKKGFKDAMNFQSSGDPTFT